MIALETINTVLIFIIINKLQTFKIKNIIIITPLLSLIETLSIHNMAILLLDFKNKKFQKDILVH